MADHFRNNFDFLRFAAAAAIIISHCFALSKGYSLISVDDPTLLFGQLGLATLLVISGFLISQSWERDPDAVRFFWKRGLRIVPGLLASALFVILFVGPLVTSLTPDQYIRALLDPATWAAMPVFKDGTPLGLFLTNPVTFVNAPLWTIPLEFLLYVIIAVLGLTKLLHKDFSILLLIFCSIGLWLINMDDPTLGKVRFIIYFLIGVFLALKKDRIPYDWRIAAAMFALLALAAVTPLRYPAAFVTIPYLVLYAAQFPVQGLHRFGMYGDFSYGMYIYSYPIEQMIVFFWQDGRSIPVMCALSLILAVFVAFVSWNLLEKRALGLKNCLKKNDPQPAQVIS